MNRDEIERPVEMHSSMLCADRAGWSCAAMYTNATEFLNKSSGGQAGQI